MNLMIANQITSQLKDNSSKAFNPIWCHTTHSPVTLLFGSDTETALNQILEEHSKLQEAQFLLIYVQG